MKKLIIFLTCGLVLGLTSCAKQIVDTTVSIYGNVVEAGTQIPLQNVMMTLMPSSVNVYTGTDGYYEFLDLNAQQYTITAQLDGYRSDRKTVTLVAGDNKQVTFALHKE